MAQQNTFLENLRSTTADALVAKTVNETLKAEAETQAKERARLQKEQEIANYIAGILPREQQATDLEATRAATEGKTDVVRRWEILRSTEVWDRMGCSSHVQDNEDAYTHEINKVVGLRRRLAEIYTAHGLDVVTTDQDKIQIDYDDGNEYPNVVGRIFDMTISWAE